MKNILAIGAHPDDIEIGCAATLLKLKDQGKKVYCLVLSNGGNWIKKTYEDRLEEQDASLFRLQIDKILFGPCKDGKITHSSELIDFITDIILEYNIDTILSHYKEDSHQDHIATSLLAKSASMNCKNLLYFEALTSTNFKPNYFVVVDKYEEKKQEILKCFTTQNDKYTARNQSLVDFVAAKDRLNGIKIRQPYAEGFIIDKLVDECAI